MSRGKWFVLAVALVFSASCAEKPVYRIVPVPEWDAVATLKPDSALNSFSSSEQEAFDAAWNSLLTGELEGASRAVRSLERSHPNDSGLLATKGFIELRTGSTQRAESLFLAAANAESESAAAHGGGFLTALTVEDEDAAFRYLQALKSVAEDHVLVGRHLVRLQLTIAEKHLAHARRQSQAGSHMDALEAYRRALDVAPEAGALYIEAASTALEAGEASEAAELSRRAIELEPDTDNAYTALGNALVAADDLPGAIEAYEKARDLSPDDEDIRRQLNRVRADYERTNLPLEYGEISETEQITREELAAVLFVTLREAFEEMPGEMNVIATDINDSWAVHFIRRVVSREILEVFPNHTFQPKGFVRRLELAQALNAAFRSLDEELYVEARKAEHVTFADLATENLSHPDASLAVTSGLLEVMGAEQAFEPNRLVSGDEAIQAVSALANLLGS